MRKLESALALIIGIALIAGVGESLFSTVRPWLLVVLGTVLVAWAIIHYLRWMES